ncbi:MAG: DUF928 domain-containing protein [Gammaproteobacteria bacterium]|nr:DUF928 domain-containing protein [Gammaproteobacteria bacterium]
MELPVYQAPESDAPMRRRAFGFVGEHGYRPRVVRGKRSSGRRDAGRGFSLAFVRSLPCGKSKGFPESLCPRTGGEAVSSSRSGSLVSLPATRGKVEVMKTLTAPEVVAPLAPRRTGLSLKDQPALYWYLSKPWQGSVEFTLNAADAEEPMLQKELAPPGKTGFTADIHSLKLAEYGIRLKPGVEYEWFVVIMGDAEQRANDLLASGTIRYVPTHAGLDKKLEKTPEEKKTHVYAKAGLWYDAVDTVSQKIARDPGNAGVRRQRAALTEQAGLPAVARHDGL